MKTSIYLILHVTLCFQLRRSIAADAFIDCQHRFSIVIDGGSSGTRLNVFQFDGDLRNPTINQTFTFKSKVALSTFSNYREDWSLMRIMLNNLTASALSVIPGNCVKETPMYLQVTAGIRQIEQRMGSRILTNIRDILSKSIFRFQRDFVDVLSPTSEGQLAWISVNYLLGNLNVDEENRRKETVGVLDLGGGSTQIAFATENEDLVKASDLLRVLGHNYNLYSHGYDFMGINEARMKYFNAQTCCESSCKGRLFRSQCLHPAVSAEYVIGNRTLLVGGKIIRDSRRFCHCFGKGLRFVTPITKIREYFGTKKFVAFSAYYYILRGAGDIFKTNSDGFYQANVRDIIFRAMEVCRKPQTISKSRYAHFLCIDLSYIVALLHNGYGFEWYDELVSSVKIKGINLSWALGYAISKY